MPRSSRSRAARYGRDAAPVKRRLPTGDFRWSVAARATNAASRSTCARPRRTRSRPGWSPAATFWSRTFGPARWNAGAWVERPSSIRPELIAVRISASGQSGPYPQRAGYAAIGEAMGGLRALTGYPGPAAERVGISIGDSLTGMFGALWCASRAGGLAPDRPRPGCRRLHLRVRAGGY